MALHGDAGKVGERGAMSGDDSPASCHCRRCDHEAVRSSRPTSALHGNKKLPMGFCDCQVIADDWNRLGDVLQNFLTA